MHRITHELQQFYDHNAKHFSQTRQKYRSDLEYIVEYINNLPHKTITVLELWCGNGKAYEYLAKNCVKTLKYTWIDLSKWLLAVAQKNNPEIKFIHQDMVQYIQSWKQESIDVIISTAAFHHLPDRKERLLVLKNAYRLLKYDGYLIMTNRSRSIRFIQHYRKPIIIALCKSIYTWGNKKRNDVYIPRKTSKGIYTGTRYYHMYTCKELESLSIHSGFDIKTNSYLWDNGNLSSDRKLAKNILTILQKKPITYSSSSS